METGGGSRRRHPPSNGMVDSPNLRDFLRVREDSGDRNLAGLTLSAVLSCEKTPSPAQVNRTLLEIIRDDPYGGKESKKSWKVFRDKLRLRRAGSAWNTTVPIPASDIPIENANRTTARRSSIRFPTTAVNSENPAPESIHPEFPSSSTSNTRSNNGRELNSMPSNRAMMLRPNSSRAPSISAGRYGRGAEGSTSFNTVENSTGEAAQLRGRVSFAEVMEDEEQEAVEGMGETAGTAEEGGEQPVRMSLMALLAETDREMGLDGSTYIMDDGEDEDKVEEAEERVNGEYNNCCVCMVRHKGSAFIPCGHTFCRLCSRELWVQRGNCPLCNGFILEILDIF